MIQPLICPFFLAPGRHHPCADRRDRGPRAGDLPGGGCLRLQDAGQGLAALEVRREALWQRGRRRRQSLRRLRQLRHQGRGLCPTGRKSAHLCLG